MRECTCGGTNPNCYKCGGWGWLGDDVAEHRGNTNELLPPFQTPLPKTKKKRAAGIARKEQNYQDGERSPKRKATESKRNLHHPTTNEAEIQCPFCRVKVRKGRLGTHLRKAHHQEIAPNAEIYLLNSPLPTTRKKSAGGQPSSARKEKSLTTCTICGAVVRVDRLLKHCARVHNPKTLSQVNESDVVRTRETSSGKRSRGSKNDLKRSDRKTSDVTSIQPPWEPRFGDKYLGYPAREAGKYGSIPLYDDYGDESSAD